MTRVIKVITEGPQGPPGAVGSATLVGLTDVTGTAGTGKSPVSDGAGHFALTDIATQAELDAAVAALSAVYQPLDSDLTAIAALSTTSFGRSLLALADAAALRTAAALGTAATQNTTAFDAAGAAAAAQAASQPLDADLTAIAALSTTAFGRAVLAVADAAALRTAAGLGTAATQDASAFDAAGAAAAAQAASQPLDGDLTAIAALATTAFGRAFLALADAAAGRTALGLGTLATQSGTFSGTSSGTNTGDQTTVTGNAGTATALQTGRTIDGQTFDGTANITVIAPGSHAATSKATPVDADELPLVDSAASNVLKKLTWANLKATIKAYTDTLYPSGSGTSSGTNTGDQTSVSGNAGTATALQTARAIDGQSFDGTAAITVIAPGTHAATSKATPVDADELPLVDSAASNVLKRLTWANVKATLKTYFDTLYVPVGGASVRLAAANVTTAVQVVSSTTETDILNYTLAANSLGANGVLRTVLVGDRLWNNNLADSIKIRVYFGGTLMLDCGNIVPGTVLNAVRTPWRFNLEIRNLNATNSQWLDLWGSIVENNANNTGIGGLYNDLIGRRGGGALLTSAAAAAIDTTASAVVRVSVQWTASSANDAWRLNHAYAELLT